MKKPIHQYDLGYQLLRWYTIRYVRIFYKQTTIVGLENIPADKPVIFATNHQNALMDALNVLLNIKTQPVFMARSDIFKNPTAAKVLRWLKILPVYRIRDGVKSLQNNDAVFEEAVAVLEDNKALGILPEGNHFGERRLRVLKKGIARIAFQAEERNNFNLNLHIVPVGLDYTNYVNFGSKILIEFGTPFTLEKYKEEYLENDQKGMNTFMQDLRDRMLPQILNIDVDENYTGAKAFVDIYTDYLCYNSKDSDNHIIRRKLMQQIANELMTLSHNQPNQFAELTNKAHTVVHSVTKLKLRNWVLQKEKYNPLGILGARILQLLFLPVFIAGWLSNIIPFKLPVLLSKNVKDEQFLSSFRFVLSIIVFTLIYLIYLILLLIFTPNLLFAFGILMMMMATGYLSFHYYVWFKKTTAKGRVNRLRRSKEPNWVKLINYRNELIAYAQAHFKI